MLRFKYWVKNFFGFPRAQVNGFVILLILVSLSLFSEPVWSWFIRNREPDFTAEKAKLDSLIAIWNVPKPSPLHKQPPDVPLKLFPFDPNIVSQEKLTALGFSEMLAKRIVKYREKGGKFRRKSDLAKIYGMDSSFYHQIYGFIVLPEKTERATVVRKKTPAKDIFASVKKLDKFDLNKVDTAGLKLVNGIGEKLSLRILKYREAIGGFVNINQLKEIYGLDTLVVSRLAERAIIGDDFQPTKININTASEKQLAAHPYIRKAAKAIVSYRFQHGNFRSVDEITNVASIDETTRRKILPYLKIDDGL